MRDIPLIVYREMSAWATHKVTISAHDFWWVSSAESAAVHAIAVLLSVAF